MAQTEESYVLSNGLKVILAPRAGKSLIYTMVVVKAGSASEEGAGEYGLAHIMEHMAFKGTAKRKPGETVSLVMANGGFTNAKTGFDETDYFIMMPKGELNLSLDLISDLVFFPSYDPEELQKEKKVIAEEISMGMDFADKELILSYFELAYGPLHPYGHSTLGNPDTIDKVTIDKVRDFHRKFYRPDNAVLILTGDFDVEEAKILIDKYFSPIESKGQAPFQTDAPIVVDGPKVQIIYSKNVIQSKILIGFHTVKSCDGLNPAINLLMSVLSSGRAYRFNESPLMQDGLVNFLDASSWEYLKGGQVLISCDTTRENVIAAIDGIIEQLNEIITKPITSQELLRVKNLTVKALSLSQETPLYLGNIISKFEMESGDFRLKDAYLPITLKLEAYHLEKAARKVFTLPNMSIIVMLPAGSEPLLDADVRNAAMGLYFPEEDPRNAGPKVEFESYSLKNGARLYALRDRSIPIVDLNIGVLGGRAAEKIGQEGINYLLAQIWAQATKERSASEMGDLLDREGISISGYSGDLVTGLSASFLSDNWHKSLSLIIPFLTAPGFNEEDFLAQKAAILGELEYSSLDLTERAFSLQRKALFGDNPLSFDILGTMDSISAISLDDIVTQYESLLNPKDLVFVVAGDINPEDFCLALEDALSSWVPKKEAANFTAPLKPVPLVEPSFLFEERDSNQSHLTLSFLAPDLTSPDRAAVDVLNSILGGLGGDLYTQLRENRALAYSVDTVYRPLHNAGSLTFYLATSSENTVPALEVLVGIIDLSQRKPFDEEQVLAAKRRLISTNSLNHLTLASLTSETMGYIFSGEGLDFNDSYLEEIQKVTPEDVQRAASMYLTLNKSALGLIGDSKSIEEAKKAALVLMTQGRPNESLF
ncbi:MAG: insulinase family protein [Deltaproteobacteria bacterium]|nr:insulinase family protein [Deltaproteobacteria bacterium]